MLLKHNRRSSTQSNRIEYPCIATNLGLTKICIHLNIDPHVPHAIVYEINGHNNKSGDSSLANRRKSILIDDSSKEATEQFYGFVEYDNLDELGLD